jgi:Xaa-Pro aminopeptidase
LDEKIKDLRAHIQKQPGLYGQVVSALDEIAWLFNLRGSDIECNPVFFSYAIITQDEALLYIDQDKLSPEVMDHLGDLVTVKPYVDFFSDLAKLNSQGKKLLVNNKTSLAVELALGEVRWIMAVHHDQGTNALYYFCRIMLLRKDHSSPMPRPSRTKLSFKVCVIAI